MCMIQCIFSIRFFFNATFKHNVHCTKQQPNYIFNQMDVATGNMRDFPKAEQFKDKWESSKQLLLSHKSVT